MDIYVVKKLLKLNDKNLHFRIRFFQFKAENQYLFVIENIINYYIVSFLSM